MAALQIKDISIQFPGVKALEQVSLEIPEGKMTALCGENGAGKSTLGKIISGVYPHGKYSGEIYMDGVPLAFKSTLEAEKKGIAIIHQELNLINDLSVAENIFLSQLPHSFGVLNFEKMRTGAKELLEQLGIDIHPDTVIRELSVSKRQIVEIAKALSKNPKILIFDEATSSLSESEIKVLFKIIDRLKQLQVTMIFVTHKLEEIFACCDHVAVLKDGKFVWARNVHDVSQSDIITAMVGRELSEMFPPKTGAKKGKELLRVENWTVYDKADSKKAVINNIAFQVHSGEILGIYGLVGAGRTELIQSIFEGKAVKTEGSLFIRGKKTEIKDTTNAIANKIALVTEDRKRTGLVLGMSVRSNLSLSSLYKYAKAGKIIRSKETKAINEVAERLKIKVPSIENLVQQLSGGNQQKVVLGKWILTEPEILILDEPTRGIDVGTKAEIYKMLREFTSENMAVIVISGELPEILGVSDRILVIREGNLIADIDQSEANEVLLAQYALRGNNNE